MRFGPLVVVATPPNGAADCAQYPKDRTKDHQDDTDCPKDGVAPKKCRDDQADDADGDQVSLRCSGISSDATLIRRRGRGVNAARTFGPPSSPGRPDQDSNLGPTP